MKSLLPLRRRSRLVTFRVSEDEYRELRKTCEATGSRSLSDLTRAAVARMTAPAGAWGPSALEDRVRDLEDAIRQLKIDLENSSR